MFRRSIWASAWRIVFRPALYAVLRLRYLPSSASQPCLAQLKISPSEKVSRISLMEIRKMGICHIGHGLRITLWSLCLLGLAGCLSPITLNRAVGAYDDAITSAASKQLLMNIARSHQRQPVHFTGVSNVAATFDFRFNAGGTPAVGGLAGSV